MWDLGWFFVSTSDLGPLRFIRRCRRRVLPPLQNAPSAVAFHPAARADVGPPARPARRSVDPLPAALRAWSSSSGHSFMFGLVLLRLNDLVLQLRETLRRERVIRDANGALAAAADRDTIRDHCRDRRC